MTYFDIKQQDDIYGNLHLNTKHMDTIQQAKAIFGEDARLEDLFRVAWSKGWEMSVSRGIKVWWLGDSEMNPSKKIPYNPTFQLLDQPNLSDIISLFR